VDEAVDAAVVAACEVRGPRPRRRCVEEVDDVGLDRRLDLRRELVEAGLIATADAGTRALVGQASDDRGPEISGTACHDDDASVERMAHVATLATLGSEE
jgi:hypothetical protein